MALSQVSNALGVVTPAAEMITAAHRHGAKVLLDGAQSVSHMRVDVQALYNTVYDIDALTAALWDLRLGRTSLI